MIYLLEAAIWTLFVSRSDAAIDLIDFEMCDDSSSPLEDVSVPKKRGERISHFPFPDATLRESLDKPSINLVETVFGAEAGGVLDHKPGAIAKVKLGKGNYGNVDLCVIHSGETDKFTIVAQKHLRSDSEDPDSASDDLLSDLAACDILGCHANVPAIYDTNWDEHKPENNTISMEPCLGGTAQDLIDQKVSAPYLLQVMEDIACGFDYLKGKKILYRDIKPDNILLGLDGEAKIADFGLAVTHVDTKPVTGHAGAVDWSKAPEMVSGPYAHESVVYGTGLLFYMLCTSRDVREGSFRKEDPTNGMTILVDRDTILGEETDDSSGDTKCKDVFVDSFKKRITPDDIVIEQGLSTKLFELLQSMTQSKPDERPPMEAVKNTLISIKEALIKQHDIKDDLFEVTTDKKRVPMDDRIRAPKMTLAQTKLKQLFGYQSPQPAQDSRRRLMQRLLKSENRMHA